MGIFDKLFGKNEEKKPKGEFKIDKSGQIYIEENTHEDKLSYYDCIQYIKGALHLKEYDNAIYHCNLAMKFNVQNPEPYIFRGLAYIQEGKKEKAIEDWKKAKDLSKVSVQFDELNKEAEELLAKYDLQKKESNTNIKRYPNYLKADFLMSIPNICDMTLFVYKIQDENPLKEEFKNNAGANYRTLNGAPLYFSFIYNSNRTLIKKSHKTELFHIDDESTRDIASGLMAKKDQRFFQALHEYYNDDNWLKTDENIKHLLKIYEKKSGERLDNNILNNFGVSELFKKNDWFASLSL